jgi:uncharacterized membrane protein YtjA (UPF0391 family)
LPILWHAWCEPDDWLNQPLAVMLYWSFMILAVAMIAGVLGFGLLAGGAAIVAKTLFVTFLVVWIASLVSGRRTV